MIYPIVCNFVIFTCMPMISKCIYIIIIIRSLFGEVNNIVQTCFLTLNQSSTRRPQIYYPTRRFEPATWPDELNAIGREILDEKMIIDLISLIVVFLIN